MNELHYQLDLMRAMNQKLSAREKMYRLCAIPWIMLISTILLKKILSRRWENGMIF